jgi:hypothetical protein
MDTRGDEDPEDDDRAVCRSSAFFSGDGKGGGPGIEVCRERRVCDGNASGP